MSDEPSTAKSKKCLDLEKKLGRQRKENSEDAIKKKLNKKELDYDTVTMILEVFEKSKFQWHEEHFDNFDLKPEDFRGKKLPKNNRECVMLGMRLGTMRSKIIYNLRGRPLTEKERQSIDDLIWDFIWYQWKEARILKNYAVTEKKRS